MSEPRGFRQAPWVTVTAAEAEGHPKGRPGLAIYLISLWLVALAGLYLAPFGIFGFSQTPILFLFWGILALNAAVFLALGSLLGWICAMVLAAREVILFVANFAGTGTSRIHDMVAAMLPTVTANYLILALAVIATVVLLYLWEGDRPNLIYRHRYRQYSALEK